MPEPERISWRGMLLRLGVAWGFLLGETPLQSGDFLFHFRKLVRLKIARQHPVPFVDRFLPLRLCEIIFAGLGVEIAKMAQNRGIVTLAAGSPPQRGLRFGKPFLFEIGPAETVQIGGSLGIFGERA